MRIPTQDLATLVAAWLPTQRWFGGKGRTIAGVQLDVPAELDGTLIGVATVTYEGGATELYQVPLAVHDAPAESMEHALLGTVHTPPGQPQWVYDALHDKDLTGVWLVGIRDEAQVGPVRFSRTADADDIPVDKPSLVLTAEQSNTSLIYSDVAILKVFRRLHVGTNPDIEVLEALTRNGAENVARLMGHVEASFGDHTYALAMLQEFLTTATDGWRLAKTSVRDLMAEADLHADEAGGDFAAEAERLGAAVAAVHAELAEAFGTSVASPEDLARIVTGMHAQLDEALTIVPALAEVADGIRAVYDRLAEAGSELSLQRIHGDLHLGQVLRTVLRWVVIDFEGAPAAPLEERRRPDSPLRDLAGMLRSFDYAARHRLMEVGNATSQLEYRADEWSRRNRDAFLTGYTAAAESDPRDQDAALRAFEADKAVYEAVYEARHRPDWGHLPLAALAQLVGTA
jgi:maltokinase